MLQLLRISAAVTPPVRNLILGWHAMKKAFTSACSRLSCVHVCGPCPRSRQQRRTRRERPCEQIIFHIPEIQPGMGNPHPQPIYTTSLTSPPEFLHLTHLTPLCESA